MKYDCLIIDDEVALCEATNEYFNTFGLTSAYATTYHDGLAFLQNHEVSLLLLDINLGDHSGFALCKEIRKTKQLPILFISARQSDDDILMALGIGGDDYIKKPYTLSVLLAKVKAMLKRCNDTGTSDIITVNNIKVDASGSKAYLNDKNLNLKSMEFKLLLHLIKNKNKVLTKDELFENVWNGGIVSDSTLNVHIRRLREKIEDNPNEPAYIKTVWGVGYLFEVDV